MVTDAPLSPPPQRPPDPDETALPGALADPGTPGWKVAEAVEEGRGITTRRELLRAAGTAAAAGLALAGSAGLVGCGGGGGDRPPPTTTLRLAVDWPARSRSVGATASALSGVLTLRDARPGGGDFVLAFDRGGDPAAHRATYTSPTPVLLGTWTASVRLFALPGGAGDVVGVAEARVSVDAMGGGVDLTAGSAIAAVEVAPGQTLSMGEQRDLAFAARDAGGRIVAVSPGSAAFAVVGGSDRLAFRAGRAVGLASGVAVVTATVDGVTSAPAEVRVTGYAFVDLSALTPPLFAFEQTALGNGGRIVGWTGTVGNYRGLLYSSASGQTTDLGPGRPAALNDTGGIVGLGNDNAPVRFEGGRAVRLPLGPAATTGNALAVNDAHVVAGLLGDYQDYGSSRAAVWENDALTDLNELLPAGSGWRRLSRAEGVNNAGVIIGVGLRESGPQTLTGFLLDRAAGTIAEIPRPPGAAADTPHLPKAINDAGHVVGETYVPGEDGNRMRGFLYRDGASIDLGVLVGGIGSSAKRINRSGEIVGNVVSPPPIPGKGVLWKDGNGDRIDLNRLIPGDSPWTIDAAVDINDAGDILARALLPGRGWRLVLLRKE